ncbi:MAG TPA: chromate transporter [Ktedonobacteraceae bacterium]|nr:chromate transporter [Ktedonobacteraceae bacterium]
MKPHGPKPGNWRLFRVWAGIGLQSFGGGASTTYLIYSTFVEKRGWLLPEEYNQFWNLSVMTPGINILALTILVGRKLGGVWGVVVSLAGLLLPSATITCLLTAGFLRVQGIAAVQAMLRGVIPATAGLMLVVGIKYAQPLLKEIKAEGFLRLFISLVVVLLVTLAIVLLQVAVALVLIGAALLGILLFSWLLPPPAPVVDVEKVKEMEEIHD